MGGEFFTDFKSSNGIEISWLVQVLSNFNWFWGSTPLGGWWMGGWGGHGYGCVGGVPCMHACTCMLNMLNMLHVDASRSVAICNFYTCIHVCVCVHACMWGHPHASRCPQTPPPTCPLPRATGSPKHQNSISPEVIEIIRFCLKILYLWTFLNSYRLQLITPHTPHLPNPPPRAEETQIRRITITLEWIKIIQFCLKICDPWILLHTYRLGLMCRWGCPIPNDTYVFDPKSAPVTLQ